MSLPAGSSPEFGCDAGYVLGVFVAAVFSLAKPAYGQWQFALSSDRDLLRLLDNRGIRNELGLDFIDELSIIDSMTSLSRKQRELKDREAQILRLARPILVREGYHGLSMDRLANQMEYAKGTLYNHFPNKEEIVLALAVESMELRFLLMSTAAVFHANSRCRLLAVGAASELFAHSTHHFSIESWIRNDTIWDKASPERQNLIRQCEARCMAVVAGIVRDAIAQGELVLPRGLSAEELVFGFWSISYGSQVLMASSPSLAALGVEHAVGAIRYHCCTLLNGFAWAPEMEFAEHDSHMTEFCERLRNEFKDQLLPCDT